MGLCAILFSAFKVKLKVALYIIGLIRFKFFTAYRHYFILYIKKIDYFKQLSFVYTHLFIHLLKHELDKIKVNSAMIKIFQFHALL